MASDPIHQKIAETIAGNDVVLFMKGTKQFPQCGFSATAAKILEHLGALRRFEHHGQVAQAWVVEKILESVGSQFTLANVLVAVDPATERLLGVVQVYRAHARQAHRPVELIHGLLVAGRRAQLVARREEVTGIDAHAEAL